LQAGEEVTVVCADDAGVHVYANCEDDVYAHMTDSEEEITVSIVIRDRLPQLKS